MTERPYYEETPATALRTWVLGQMLRGAGYGALFVFTIGLLMYAIWGFGQLLPDASKEAPPPMGWLTETATPAVA